MTESRTLAKPQRPPWEYERMFRLAHQLWQRPEQPDPEAAEVNDVVRGVGPALRGEYKHD